MSIKSTSNAYLRILAALAIMLLVSACTQSSTNAEPANKTKQSVQARGQTLDFSNPEGYCNYGDSRNEQELIKQSERALAPIVLLHAAALCTDLKEVAAGKRSYLNQWLQIQLIEQVRPNQGREKFLTNLAQQMPQLETDEMRQSIQDATGAILAKEGIDIELGTVKFLGRDENAVYLSAMMEAEFGDHKAIVTALIAHTMIKGLHVSINFYDGSEDPQSLKNLPDILQDFLNNILAANPD